MEYRFSDADFRALHDLALLAPMPDSAPQLVKTLLVFCSVLRAEAGAARQFDLTLDPVTPTHDIHLGREEALEYLDGSLRRVMERVRDSNTSAVSFTERSEQQANGSKAVRPPAEGEGKTDRTIVTVHRDRALVVCAAISRGVSQLPFSDSEVAIARRLFDSLHWTAATPSRNVSTSDSGLSPRAREVLEHLKVGRAEKEIATRLAISPHTVHFYAKEIYSYYGVATRAQLLSLWLRQVN